MSLNITSVVIEIITTLLGLICVYELLFYYPKCKDLLVNLDDNDYTMKDCYCIGLGLADQLHFKYTGKWYNQERTYLSILKDKRYTEYYLRIADAKRLSLALVTALIILAVCAFVGDKAPVIAVFGILAGAAVFISYSNQNKNAVKKRADEMVSELPEVASRLALLINAGMMLKEAWEAVSLSGESKLYQEMRVVNVKTANGMSDTAAIYEFGRDSDSEDIRKFCSRIIQAVDKGGAQLTSELMQQSEEMWEFKRQLVLRKADANAQKLLVPLLIMFVGILILVIVPIVSGMSS